MSDEKGYRGFQIYRTANPTPVRKWDYAAHLWDDPESGLDFMGANVDDVKRDIDFELDDSPPEIFIQRGNQTWFSAKGYHDPVETSEAELTKYVLAKSPWVDVSDPPEVGRLVFVDSSGMLPVVAYMDDLGAWYSETTKMWVLNVTRWMPIPT